MSNLSSCRLVNDPLNRRVIFIYRKAADTTHNTGIWYLDYQRFDDIGGRITFADHGPQRKNTETVPYNGCPSNPPALDKNCDGVPDSEFGEVQPAFGAGPTWLGRLVTEPAK